MVCPSCGAADNPPDALYCEQCGEPLSADAHPAAAAIAISELPVPTPAEVEGHSAQPTSGSASASVETNPTPAPVPSDDATISLPAAKPAAVAATTPAPPARPAFDMEATMELAPPRWSCPSCGARNDATDDFCVDCGAERTQGPAPLQPGEVFAGWTVLAQTAADRYELRGPTDAADQQPATLRFGEPAALAELTAVLTALAPGGDPQPPLVPALLAHGADPHRGGYVVTSRPEGTWTALDHAGPLHPEAAAAVLRSLLVGAAATAAAERLLLMSPAAVQIDDAPNPRTLLENPLAPALPLTGPLLADPAYLAPELRPGATAPIDPFRAGAYSAAATLHAATGSALGFPPAWHAAIATLSAADPAARPAELPAALASLDALDANATVAGHRVAFLTDIGNHHPVNQDAGGAWSWQREDGTPITLAVVCDGVSAGDHSEDAAQLAVELLHEMFEQHWADADLTPDRAIELLRQAGMEAHKQICAMPAASYDHANATTLVAACIIGPEVAGIWCGDSRAYGVTAEGVVQLTKDHSWVNLMIDAGKLTPEQARRDPRAHVIARWLGASDTPHIDPGFEPFRRTLAPGDRLLLCSDGLYMYFDAPDESLEEMGTIALKHGAAIDDAVDELVGTALQRGGFDNISVALVEMLPAPAQPTPGPG